VAERREKDHYATLNIRRDATLQEIKAAYRILARKVLFASPSYRV
jgi:molecular chaperone DnaJ